MMFNKIMLTTLACGICLPVFAKELIAPNSNWAYFDQPEAPQQHWQHTTFDDSHWQRGAAAFGYGEDDEQTVTSYGIDPHNKPLTQYFRKTFEAPAQAIDSALILRYLVDDGAVFFLNGVEIHRVNLPSEVGHHTTATHSNIEHVWIEAPLDNVRLHSGVNTLAVEVHQISRGSSDISFDAALLIK